MSVVVMLEGGMGSQMFGYAYGRALSLKNETDLILNHTQLCEHRIPRDYSLGVFDIVAKLLQPRMRIENPVIKVVGYDYMGLNCFKGYESIIRKDFTFTIKAKEQLCAKKSFIFFDTVAQCNSVSIGIRRGDFAYDPIAIEHHGVIPLDYYHEAIKHIASRITKPVFFIFSDDIEWVKENLRLEQTHFYISGEDFNFQEEWLLNSCCKHHIISNSTFHWWGAWHNPFPETIVCAPKYWHHKYKPKSDFFPKGWVLL